MKNGERSLINVVDGLTIRTIGLIFAISGTAVGLSLSVLQLEEIPDVSEVAPVTPVTPAAEITESMAFDDSHPADPGSTAGAPAIRTAPVPSVESDDIALQADTALPTAPTAPPDSDAAPTTPPLVAPIATSPTPATSTEYLAYRFEDVAEIVVAFHDDDRLEFWSVVVDAGWSYAVEKPAGQEVEVKFRRTGGSEGEAKFELEIEDGQLEVKKER